MRTVRTVALLLVLAIVAVAAAGKDRPPVPKPRPPFTISKATTYVTGPLTKDGSIDYAAALNQRLSRHVQPGDNANVLLWQVFGPHPLGATMPAEYFRWLGTKRPPERGNYWVSRERFLRDHPELSPRQSHRTSEAMEIADEQLRRCSRGPWQAKKFSWIAAWLQVNAKPLDLAITATHRPKYFNPLMPQDDDGLVGAPLPGTFLCREVADALLCRAMLALSKGHTDAAWHDLLACHRLARLISQGSTVIEFLVGGAIESTAGRAALAFLAHAKLDARHTLAALRDLQRLPPMAGLADKIDLTERFSFLDSITKVVHHGVGYLEVLAGGPGPKKATSVGEFAKQAFAEVRLRMMNWDAALESGNHWYDRVAAALRIKVHATRNKALLAITADLEKARMDAAARAGTMLLLPSKDDRKVMAEILISLLMPAILKVQQAGDRIRQVDNNLYIAFALQAYRQNHGQYPANLSALRSTYLRQIPNDLFTGKPLIYRPTRGGYLLYSVGVNGKDEQGRGPEDHPPGDDLSVRMPLLKP